MQLLQQILPSVTDSVIPTFCGDGQGRVLAQVFQEQAGQVKRSTEGDLDWNLEFVQIASNSSHTLHERHHVTFNVQLILTDGTCSLTSI